MREMIKLFNKHCWVYLVFVVCIVGLPISRMFHNTPVSVILATGPVASLALIYCIDEFVFKTYDRKVVLRRMSKKEYERMEAYYKSIYSEYAYLSEMMQENIEKMGLNRRDFVAPGWFVNFNVMLRRYLEKRKGMPFSDLYVAAAIMQVLIGPETSLEDVEVIYNAVKPLIENPKEYKGTVVNGRCFLEEVGKLPGCNADEYKNYLGDYEFFKLIKDSALMSYSKYKYAMELCDLILDIHIYGYALEA